MEGKTQRAVVTAAVVGLLAAAGAAVVSAEQQAGATGGKTPCYGINKCKGACSCGGKGHSCAGMNACKGQGYLMLEKDTCLKIESGRLTSEPSAS